MWPGGALFLLVPLLASCVPALSLLLFSPKGTYKGAEWLEGSPKKLGPGLLEGDCGEGREGRREPAGKRDPLAAGPVARVNSARGPGDLLAPPAPAWHPNGCQGLLRASSCSPLLPACLPASRHL